MLTVSCVLYHPDKQVLAQTLDSLDAAIGVLNAGNARHVLSPLYMINNADTELNDYYDYQQLLNCRVVKRSNHGNVGYGAGHNIAIKEVSTQYHLVINPDVILQETALLKAIQYMDDNPSVALVSPFSTDPVTGQLQYLCKQFPSVAVLALRFINLPFLNKVFETTLAQYEERLQTMANKRFDAKIVSGCFMLFRTDVLKQLGGFDERYFLYFEDFDLSIRAKQLGRVVCHPDVIIKHYGGGAGRKGWAHVKLFLRSAKMFFDQHGWRWF